MDTILINGVTYYKLEDIYPGDTTKHCSLKTEDMDQNFHALRGLDIESFALSGNSLVLRRLDGSEMKVELNEGTSITTGNLTFNYNSESGNLEITYPDSTTTVISGFTTSIYTDGTLDGDGSANNPLKFSKIERTGVFAPADEYIELEHGEYLPTEGVEIGYRIVTKELKDNLGKLYNKVGYQIISDYLAETDSEWRIPTKADWDKLLDSLEPENYVDIEHEFYPHSSTTIGYLGKEAAQHLKSGDFKINNNPIQEDSTCGYDTIGFNIVPVGVALRDEYDEMHNEGFLETSVFWTSTLMPTENAKYVKGFFYDTNKVLQSLGNDQFISIRLVKDYTSDNYMGDEGIFGQTYPTVLCNKANQVWTAINVFATKNQIQQLIKGVNYTDVVVDGDTSDISDAFYINEFNGNEWIKKELKEGDSIVILSRDTEEDITNYYRKWTVKDGELVSFEDYVNTEIETFNATIEEMRSSFSHKISALTETFEHQISELTNDFSQSIQTLSDNLSTQIARIDERLETFINDELENTIKYTIKNYIQGTPNEIKITETDYGKLKFSLDNIPHDNHEYVDLGLPSRLLWATTNIQDADGNELYFAWGETSGYTSGQVITHEKNFSWGGKDYENDYKFGPYDENDDTNSGMTRYNHNDNLSALTITNEPPINEIDDAAVVNWGNGWRMPTKADFEELIANTEYEWTTVNDVQGVKVTSTVEGHTDKFLFFPAVGDAYNGRVRDVGSYGYYWSSSLRSDKVTSAWELYFSSGRRNINYRSRYIGCPVRPVRF